MAGWLQVKCPQAESAREKLLSFVFASVVIRYHIWDTPSTGRVQDSHQVPWHECRSYMEDEQSSLQLFREIQSTTSKDQRESLIKMRNSEWWLDFSSKRLKSVPNLESLSCTYNWRYWVSSWKKMSPEFYCRSESRRNIFWYHQHVEDIKVMNLMRSPGNFNWRVEISQLNQEYFTDQKYFLSSAASLVFQPILQDFSMHLNTIKE